jgi:hypothetical protein
MHCLRNTEVGDLCATFTTDQDIARGDIAMNDAAHMCRSKSARHLSGHRCSATWHQWANAPQH